MRIAIVEDETKLAELIDDYLSREGYDTVRFANGEEALANLSTDEPDLVLLDLMLPGLDGMSLCRELRRTSTVPVIMLTARVEEIDRLLGLEIGANDYICKPFSPREVVARVKAVLRRTASREAALDQRRRRAYSIGLRHRLQVRDSRAGRQSAIARTRHQALAQTFHFSCTAIARSPPIIRLPTERTPRSRYPWILHTTDGTSA